MAILPFADGGTSRRPVEVQMTAQCVWADEVQLAYLVDHIQLVASELVTNAVVHARTPVRVRIEELPSCVKLTVHDGAADLPVLRLERRTSADAENGRGMWVIDACSAEWGSDLRLGSGRSTWALFGGVR
jgi:anti-sigma regulatory factor (Ser/Thr protein kinase)